MFPVGGQVASLLSRLIRGTLSNDSAAAGYLGEFVSTTLAVGSAVSLTTATSANIVSMSLTPGDWDVMGFVNFNLGAATGTLFQSGPSVVSATLPAQAGGSGLGTDALSVFPVPITGLTGNLKQDSGLVRVSIAATTTVYLVAQATFTVGTCTGFGTLRARRVR